MFVAKKPCNFAGKRFAIGEQIPEGLIDDNRKRTLLKFGTIAKVDRQEDDDIEQTPPENGENEPNNPEMTEDGEKPVQESEGGKNDVKTSLNTTPKPAARQSNRKPASKNKQKGGK